MTVTRKVEDNLDTISSLSDNFDICHIRSNFFSRNERARISYRHQVLHRMSTHIQRYVLVMYTCHLLIITNVCIYKDSFSLPRVVIIIIMMMISYDYIRFFSCCSIYDSFYSNINLKYHKLFIKYDIYKICQQLKKRFFLFFSLVSEQTPFKINLLIVDFKKKEEEFLRFLFFLLLTFFFLSV